MDIGEQRRVIQVEPEPIRVPERPAIPETEPITVPEPEREIEPANVPVP